MSTDSGSAAARTTPRLGFLGVGWIGRQRMAALAASGTGRVVAIADAAPDRARAAAADAPGAICVDSLDALLELDLDGVVIATPSGQHAEQCQHALERGLAVFCQKPLARTADEAAAVVTAARAADRLLGIDLSYRHTAAMRAVRDVVASGEIGDIYAVELVFHNAYGPDKGWARDPALAGGGCVIDLGTHMVDLALWTLDFPAVQRVHSRLYARGRRLEPGGPGVCEDFAVATLELGSGAVARLACSWEVSAGCDAAIQATFFGSRGGISFRNVGGSFYDFTAELHRGAASRAIVTPPDAWGGRALVDWCSRLAENPSFDPEAERAVAVAAVLDRVLGR